MKLILTLVSKRKVNNEIVLTKTNLAYQKNLHLCEDNSLEYDSLDFQVNTNLDLDIAILDIVHVKVVDTSEEFSFCVIGVIKNNIDNNQTSFSYTINCTELSKRLEFYSLTRDFSQPTVNDLEILPYDGYTNRLKMVDECKEFTYFVKDEDKQIIMIRCWDLIDANTIADLSVELGTENIPQYTANNDNLKDVLDNIFSGIGAVARLDYDLDNDKIILVAHKQNIIGSVIDMGAISATKETKSINGYGTVANPVMQNIIGQDNLATNGTNGRAFYGEETFFDTSTAKAVVDYPIKDVVNFWVSRLDNTAIKGSLTEIDIAANIVYNNQKRFLDLLEDNVSGETSSLSQNNTISFNIGDYEIVGFGSDFEGTPFPFITNKKTCWENICRSYGITNNSDNNNIQNFKFRIKYIPITNEKVEVFKNNYDEQNYLAMTPIQPNGNMIDFKRATNTLQDMVDKTGGNITEVTKFINANDTVTLASNWFELGSVDKNTYKKIIKKDWTLTNGNVICIYTLTAEEGYYNALNTVDSMKRESAIESGINRDVIVNDFVNIGFTHDNNNTSSSLTTLGIRQFASTFDNNLTVASNIDNGILVIEDLNYKLASAPILKTVGKDYAKVGYRANNPTNIGYKRINDNNKQAVNYTMLNGTLQKIGLSYGIADTKMNNTIFNKELPEINKSRLGDEELENLFEGNKLINLGDVGAIDIEFEKGEVYSQSEAINDNPSGIDQTANINGTKTYTFEGKNVYPKSLNLTVNTGSLGTLNMLSGTFKIYFDNVLIYSEIWGKGEISKISISTALEQSVVGASVKVEYDFNITVGFFNSSTMRYTLEVEERKEIITESDLSTSLTVKKTPNEILGIFHGLNAIKHKRIITGQALFTKNKLYSDVTQTFKVYGSTDAYYYDNQTSVVGVELSNAITVNAYENYLVIRLDFASSLDLKSYAIFNTEDELILAVNSEYDRYINEDDKLIYFNFTSIPNGLILE